MKCKKCSNELIGNVKFCGNCGEEKLDSIITNNNESENNNDPKINFFEVSNGRLIILMVITLGFYSIYWFGRNFQSIKEIRKLQGKKTHYVLWALFSPITSEILFKEVRKAGEKANSDLWYPPYFLSSVYFIGMLGSKFLWKGTELDILNLVGGMGTFIFLIFLALAISIYPIFLSQAVLEKIRLNGKEPDVHKLTTKYETGEIILIVITTILSVLAFIGLLTPAQNSADSIQSMVTETKKSMIFPQKIDDTTTLVDMLAKQNAIRYLYAVESLGTTQLTNTDLKNNLISSVCNGDTRTILDNGINVEYSYFIKDSSQTFFVTMTKSDCI